MKNISVFGKDGSGKTGIITALCSFPLWKEKYSGKISISEVHCTENEDAVYDVPDNTDAAIIVTDATLGISSDEYELAEVLREREIPFVMVMSKSEMLCALAPMAERNMESMPIPFTYIHVSGKTGAGVENLCKSLEEIPGLL